MIESVLTIAIYVVLIGGTILTIILYNLGDKRDSEDRLWEYMKNKYDL